jgi:hypothetical protein
VADLGHRPAATLPPLEQIERVIADLEQLDGMTSGYGGPARHGMVRLERADLGQDHWQQHESWHEAQLTGDLGNLSEQTSSQQCRPLLVASLARPEVTTVGHHVAGGLRRSMHDARASERPGGSLR